MTIANICLPLGLVLLGVGGLFQWKARDGCEAYFWWGGILIFVAITSLPSR